jgi:hypothetical protein
MAQKPIYTHDCDKCVYLGTYENRRHGYSEQIDCYWCAKPDFPRLSSILGRYGSDGPQYSSSMPPEAFAYSQDYLITAEGWYLFALLQATLRGLYKPEKKDD